MYQIQVKRKLSNHVKQKLIYQARRRHSCSFIARRFVSPDQFITFCFNIFLNIYTRSNNVLALVWPFLLQKNSKKKKKHLGVQFVVFTFAWEKKWRCKLRVVRVENSCMKNINNNKSNKKQNNDYYCFMRYLLLFFLCVRFSERSTYLKWYFSGSC